MCSITAAFKKMVADTPGMTYPKLALMIGEENHKKLQALFDDDRPDRPLQVKYMVPSMAACNNLTPLQTINAHFGLTTFQLTSETTKIDLETVVRLITESSKMVQGISTAIKPTSPGGAELTKNELQSCLDYGLSLVSEAMGVVMALKDELNK